jgi:predicted O-linked N-acetylglucosamine transferase (SPINDLY family)
VTDSRRETSGELATCLAIAFAHHQRGDLDAAEILYLQCLAASPRFYDALHLLGVVHLQRGRLDQSISLLSQALREHPREPNAHAHMAQALLQLGRWSAAIEHADASVRLNPSHAQAWFTRADAHQHLKQYAPSIESYAQGLAIDAQVPEAWSNQSNALRMLRRFREALEHANRALLLRPKYPQALNNRGLIRFDLNQLDEAVCDFAAALTLDPRHLDARMNLAAALTHLKRHDEAAEHFARIGAVQPKFPYIDGRLLYARSQTFDWTDYAAVTGRIRDGVGRRERADLPMSFLCVSGEALEQRQCAQIFAAAEYPMEDSPPLPKPVRHDGKPTRIAYLSGDFGEHAVSYLLAGVWERHDRGAFETYAISWGRRQPSAMRSRVEAAFDHFIDVSDKDDGGIAALIRELQIALAIDLTGYTRGYRTGILARRPAPVQVNFLGFPASMGTSCMDYLIADRFVIPEDRISRYTEKIVWMPETYQPNDDRRVLPSSGASRPEFGLPDRGFVFCSFNEASKLNPVLFDAWARILAAVPGSVLWVLAPGSRARDNLRREAAIRGLEPERLIFASHLPYIEHLWRYALADLFLDSTPFSAGATASDAVSMGLPILTVDGDSFASRMAAGILKTLGMQELIATSLDEYEDRAIALARDGARLAAMRGRLTEALTMHPYFHSERYCRHLEAAYTAMLARAEAGLAPDFISIEALPR